MDMKRIISCSRRTDIPAFYSRWLVNRLRAGYCHTFNPFGGQIYRVSLEPEDCIALVFWTRNPRPLLPYLDELDQRGYVYYFNFTILGYPKAIDSHNPSLEACLWTFRKLAERLESWRMQWRYDPIVFSTATPVEYHLDRFERIARALEGHTQHCTFSFVDFYGKTRRNLKHISRESGIYIYQPSLEEQLELVRRLADIAAAHGISFNSCCDDALLAAGTQKNHCIDPSLIRRLAPSLKAYPDFKPTRQDCGCVASFDIGVYDTCLFGCSYCYATNHRQAALRRHAQHNPTDSLLWRPEHLLHQDIDALAVPLKS